MSPNLVGDDDRDVRTDDLVKELVEHPLYERIRNEDDLRCFMRSHVFCVWDFQSLLKALQRRLTCVEVPWLPSSDSEARRLINEIVLDEESDEMPAGGYLSHFELYLQAMEKCHADRGPILRLIEALRGGISPERALAETEPPPGVVDFVTDTLRIARCGDIHRIAAAFTYGREDVIPGMFQEIVGSLARAQKGHWDLFLLYLNRHIETDGERHGPLSRSLVRRLCGVDDRLWQEAEETARACLRGRLKLWDQILAQL